MKAVAAICLVVAALSWPAAGRADERAHRLALAGTVLTAAGAATSLGGAALVTWGELNPPAPYPSVQPHFCSVDTCGSVPGPTNWPVVGGAVTLAVGAAALGTGITLLVIGRRAERPSLALVSHGVGVRF